MLGDKIHLQDILLTISLGHSLSDTKSVFAMLSNDIMQNILAVEIEASYWKTRLDTGLMTPLGLTDLKCDQVPVQSKNIEKPSLLPVARLAKPLALKEKITPTQTLPCFFADRYADLICEIQDEENDQLSASGHVPQPLNLMPRKFGRVVNDTIC